MTNLNTARNTQRLNKFVALSLGVSRRKADELIEKGKIIVDGQPARLGQQISEVNRVSYNGNFLKIQDKKLIALNKPVGYLCSRASQGGIPTIYELLPKSLHHLKPVGRLDKDSSGLILLTNDGDFAYRMTHPKFAKTKQYRVRLDRSLEPLHQQMISDFGIELDDGRSQLILTRLDDNRREWHITMSEGRNRQIRRTFAALGYTVTRLHRTNFGNYALGDINQGEWREVNIS